MQTICRLSRHSAGHALHYQRRRLCTSHSLPAVYTVCIQCVHTQPVSCRYFSQSKKAPQDFIEWQEDVRTASKTATAARGLDKFDDSAYSDKFKLVVQDDDGESIKEQMVEALLSAIELYKDREPRLKQDHPQFIQWCISRMFEYEITDRLEIYELLFECFPRHVYYAPGLVERLFPKNHPGLHAAVDLVNLAHKSGLKPSNVLYRNVHRSFGAQHILVTTVRRWAWWHYVFSRANPYPVQHPTTLSHQQMSEYVAERTMDQKCQFEEIRNSVGEYVGTAIISETQRNLAVVQTPDDNMRLSGPHSMWVGSAQRWYWVLRREERGEEFEGAPLSVVLSPYKELSREAAQLFLEDYRSHYKGLAGSTVIFDNPAEVLAIDAEAHFKERVSLFSDGIADVHVDSSLLPQIHNNNNHQHTVKKLTKIKDNTVVRRDKDAYDKDDEW